MVISHNGDNYSHYIKWWFHGIYPLLMVNIWTVETSYLQTMFHRSSHLGDLLLFLPQNSRGAGSWFFSHRRGLFFQPTNGNLGHIIYIIIYIWHHFGQTQNDPKMHQLLLVNNEKHFHSPLSTRKKRTLKNGDMTNKTTHFLWRILQRCRWIIWQTFWLKVVASEFARLDPKDEYQHDPTYTNRIFFAGQFIFRF